MPRHAIRSNGSAWSPRGRRDRGRLAHLRDASCRPWRMMRTSSVMQPQTRRAMVLSTVAFCAAAAIIGSGEARQGAGGLQGSTASQAGRAGTGQAPPTMRWYKGNTHTHTINNGGDSTPDEVVRWYRSHGYQFLVLTDHNFLTNVAGLNAVHAADEMFLVVAGEEVTSRAGDKP